MELKKELPDVGLCAVFIIVGKRFEVNVFDAYTDEEYLPFMPMLTSLGVGTENKKNIQKAHAFL